MIKIINIGTEINLEDLIQSRLLIQANSGGGKSVLARTIIEEAAGKVPFIIMDIEGEYYTLKEKFGDILVIGGKHADVPINIKSAELLPKEIIANRVSVVLDLSDLKMSDRILYAKIFIETMMDLRQEYWVNYLIFIEEAHKLCGEQDKQESAAAIKDLMSRGRKRGYCGVLITQRISKLHKDAAAECNNKFIGRTFLDIDLKRAVEELGLTSKSDKFIIRDLKPGTFYAFGTSIMPHEVHLVKINLPKTKIPKAGVNVDIKPKQPTEKVKAILSKLNTLPEKETGKKALNIETTSRNIPVKVKSYEQEYKAEVAKNSELLKQLQARDRYITLSKKGINIAMKALSDINEVPDVVFTADQVKVQTVAKQPPSTQVNVPVKPTDIGKCAWEIIKFLGSFPDRAFSKAQIGISIGYSPNTGGFNNALSELNKNGLISKEGSKIKASNSVAEFLGSDFEPQHYSIDTYKSKLGKCEREIYDVLLTHPETAFTKEDLAALTPSMYSANTGGFNNALSTLNTLELIKRDRGYIQLNPELLQL